MITIRKATIDDVGMIAEAVGMAIGDGSAQDYCGGDWRAVLAEVASLENSQYSYRNALIAEVDGSVAGAVVGYDGARLDELRTATLSVIYRYNPELTFAEDETEAGEYYLDSLYVRPEYRKMGVATRLIDAFCDKAFAEGHERVGLIVDFDNPNAERLYTSLGFKRIKTRIFLGHPMWHLQKK